MTMRYLITLLLVVTLLLGCERAPAPPALVAVTPPVAAPEEEPPSAIVKALPQPKDSRPSVPIAALRYQRDLIRQARAVWGMDAPIASFAGQVHQESGWRPDARSKFAGGLAQFTPGTADWIAGAYPAELGENQPMNPAWALRALARYDKHLWDRQTRYASDCDRFAFALSAYNGGEGWVRKRQRAALVPGQYATTSRINPGIRSEFQAENENYPRRILLRWQPIYLAWGPGIDCRGRMA
jgi:soluble lytic murein transglycosylase-like protein